MDDRQARILRFLELIEPLKSIQRATILSDHSRHESDADHSWHMALFALLFYRQLHEDVAIEKVLTMILVHDLGEIGAGDTFAFSNEHGDPTRERQALKALLSALPSDLSESIAACWNEFTFGDSGEARFARALDRLQALAQNVFSGGHTWRERGVTEAMSRDLNNEAMSFDPALHSIFEMLYQRAKGEGLWTREQNQQNK
jgi:putative hydrolase of HD superfamily